MNKMLEIRKEKINSLLLNLSINLILVWFFVILFNKDWLGDLIKIKN